nr:hypothetical protein [Tanacetum cinerariifolium]
MSQKHEAFWYRVLNEFNSKKFQKRTKDMLTSKWHTLMQIPKVQRRVQTGQTFGEKWQKRRGCDETGSNHDARPCPTGKPRPAKKTKSDATASTGGSSASTQFGELMEQELRLKRKAAERAYDAQAEKDRTLMRLEELRGYGVVTSATALADVTTPLIYNKTHHHSTQKLPNHSLNLNKSISPKKGGRKKTKSKRGKNVEDEPVAAGRWLPVEEELLATCYVAVSEDNNVERSQKHETFWYRVLIEFNSKIFQKRTKDMLTSKWHTLNANCQKFNATYKRAKRLEKSGENDVDVMKRAQSIYRHEHKWVAFCQEDAWAILKFHLKWDAPDKLT